MNIIDILMFEQQLQLQISLNIGSKKYQIKVPKQTNLVTLVQAFLKDNHLNPKYQEHIIRIVKDKLAEEQRKQEENTLLDQINHNELKQQQDSLECEPIKYKNNNPQITVNNAKNILLSKIQKEIQATNKENHPSRTVYEQWKQRQKQKNSKNNKTQKSYQSSRVVSHREKHDPDYFYKKGVQFQNQCYKNCEDQFKKHYPFKINNTRITESNKEKLYQRLSKEKSINPKIFLINCLTQTNLTPKQPKKVDVIKERVREQDSKIDRLVFKMIKQRSITPRKQGQSTSKSPFRKTLIR